MKKKIRTFLKSNFITIWFVAVIAVLGVITVSASYMSSNYAKRVVSRQGGNGMRFSSNYLTEGSAARRTVTTSDVYIYVCNYEKNNITHVNKKTIVYDITAVLVDSSGKEIPPGGLTSEQLDSVFFGKSLDAADLNKFEFNVAANNYQVRYSSEQLTKTAGTCTYVLKFPDDLDNNNIFVKVTAEPKNDPDLRSLSSVFGTRSPGNTDTDTIGWDGLFTDDFSLINAVRKPSEYDGFNYRISGAGEGTATLRWNTKYVELSVFSLEDMQIAQSEVNTDDDYSFFTFTVGDNDFSAYDIWFYRKQSADADKENYGTITYGGKSYTTVYRENEPYVIFDFEPIESGGSPGNG